MHARPADEVLAALPAARRSHPPCGIAFMLAMEAEKRLLRTRA